MCISYLEGSFIAAHLLDAVAGAHSHGLLHLVRRTWLQCGEILASFFAFPPIANILSGHLNWDAAFV